MLFVNAVWIQISPIRASCITPVVVKPVFAVPRILECPFLCRENSQPAGKPIRKYIFKQK
jgi:hypothetical protein